MLTTQLFSTRTLFGPYLIYLDVTLIPDAILEELWSDAAMHDEQVEALTAAAHESR